MASERPNNWPFSNWLDLENISHTFGKKGIPDFSVFYREFNKTAFSILNDLPFETPPSVFSRVDFGFTANTWFGARSRRTFNSHRYAISIDAGSWLQLYMVLRRLLSRPDVLGSFGAVIGQPRGQLALPVVRSGGSMVTLFEGDERDPSIEFDPSRMQTSFTLIQYSLLFLFLHELAHIREGHLEFRVHEFEIRKELTGDTFSSLEHLADMDAVIWGAHIVNMYASNRREQQMEINSPSQSCAAELLLWGFACSLVFLVLECFDSDACDQHRHPRHPPSSLRRLFVRVALSGSPIDFPGIEKTSALEAFEAGAAEAERAWDEMGWTRHEFPTLKIEDLTAILKKAEHLRMRLRPPS